MPGSVFVCLPQRVLKVFNQRESILWQTQTACCIYIDSENDFIVLLNQKAVQ